MGISSLFPKHHRLITSFLGKQPLLPFTSHTKSKLPYLLLKASHIWPHSAGWFPSFSRLSSNPFPVLACVCFPPRLHPTTFCPFSNSTGFDGPNSRLAHCHIFFYIPHNQTQLVCYVTVLSYNSYMLLLYMWLMNKTKHIVLLSDCFSI